MKHLEYSIKINADKRKVWNTMLDRETYKEWVNVSWPGSIYEGKWAKGENISFITPGMGGTLANITEYKPYEFVLATHIAVITSDGSEDRESNGARSWIGITESYTVTQQNGMTDLKVDIETNPEWEKMFDDGWPDALEKLKEMCESK